MVTYQNITQNHLNSILKKLFEARRKLDSRGLIYVKDMYKAISDTYAKRGLLPDEVMHGMINMLVLNGYLEVKKFKDGYMQFFLTYDELVYDEYGKVYGVKHRRPKHQTQD